MKYNIGDIVRPFECSSCARFIVAKRKKDSDISDIAYLSVGSCVIWQFDVSLSDAIIIEKLSIDDVHMCYSDIECCKKGGREKLEEYYEKLSAAFVTEEYDKDFEMISKGEYINLMQAGITNTLMQDNEENFLNEILS